MNNEIRFLCCLFLYVTFMTILVVSCRKEALPPTPVDAGLFEACVVRGTAAKLEIVSFNVESFPKSGYTSVTTVAALIKAIDPDVVALQEVTSKADFDRLIKLMNGWSGYYNPVNNDQLNLAFLIKTSEIEVMTASEKLLFTDDPWAFPRAPYEIKVKHNSSKQEICLINLHLKCCSGQDNENSRKTASQKLKNYLDTSRPKDAVVMLGDYNDEISSSAASENPFLNFITDPTGYTFTDIAIAKGNAFWWSYPSYPSHIDHILVTNELFSSIDTIMVIKAGPCYPDYQTNISDHRPVEVRIVFK